MAPFQKNYDAISSCKELEQLREQIAQMERSNLVQSGTWKFSTKADVVIYGLPKTWQLASPWKMLVGR